MARGKSGKKLAAFAGVLKGGLLVAGGVAAGYCWRSYLPLALPFESRLVADASSKDYQVSSLEEVAKAAEDRVASLEAERDRLKNRVEELEEEHSRKDAEMGDLAIRSVLGGK